MVMGYGKKTRRSVNSMVGVEGKRKRLRGSLRWRRRNGRMRMSGRWWSCGWTRVLFRSQIGGLGGYRRGARDGGVIGWMRGGRRRHERMMMLMKRRLIEVGGAVGVEGRENGSGWFLGWATGYLDGKWRTVCLGPCDFAA